MSTRVSRFKIVGDPEPDKELYLPDTLDDYRDLWADLQRLAESDPFAWKVAMRLWSAGDLYFLGMFLSSVGEVYDPYHDRPRFWAPEQLDAARWVQFESDGGVLVASRFFGKSTWSTFLRNIQTKLCDPNRVSAIFSHTREASTKHLGRIGQELLTNVPLRQVWDDRLPAERSLYPEFKDVRIVLPRTSARQEGTWEAHAFVDRLPTGDHYDERYYDDIEDRSSVRTPEAMRKVEEQFVASQNLTSPVRYAMVSGTIYHPQGTVRSLYLKKGWKSKIIPGELVHEKPAEGEKPGPLGGRAHFFHVEELWDQIRQMGGANDPSAKSEYAAQIACEPVFGQPARLNPDLLLWYDDDPIELAKTGTLYLCVDPSPGVNDPTWAWVWRLWADRRFYWVGGFRRRVPPSQRRRDLLNLALEYDSIGDLVEWRIEEFGQAEYIEPQKSYNESRGHSVPIVKCADSSKSKLDRHLERWEPMLKAGRVVFPRHLWSEDENGRRIDLVDYFVTNELGQYPLPVSDDGLDAGSRIWEPEERVGSLAWPASASVERRRRYSRGEAGEGGTYMSEGLY